MDDEPEKDWPDAESDPKIPPLFNAHADGGLSGAPGGGAEAEAVTRPAPRPTHRIMVVVGTHLRAEAADRPLAYRLLREMENWVDRHRERLEVEIVPVVCSDLWYLNHDDLRRLPTVCIGGPGVNALSAFLAQHLVEEDRDAEVLLQIDEEFTDLQACVWGLDHPLTAYGVEQFLTQYLDGFMRAVATQIEP